MEWISVNDDLPDVSNIGKCNEYLCIAYTTRIKLTYIKEDDMEFGKWYFSFRNIFEDWTEFVSYWMELPNYPPSHTV